MIEKQKGVWIAFEGIDYSGKSDQCKRFAEFLTHDLGIGPVIETREPGGYWYAEKIRELFNDEEITDDPETQLLLVTAARRRNIIKTIWPAWESGAIVLDDRSEGSTFDYQHFQQGLDLKMVDIINDFATDGRKPDLTVLLDITVKTAFSRRLLRSGKQSLSDSMGSEIFKKRREGYLWLAKNYEKLDFNPWVLVDANGSKKEVLQSIIEAIRKSKLITGL